MPGENDPKIPRIPWKGSRPTEGTDLSNKLSSLEIIKQERERAERIVASSADYVLHISARRYANEHLAAVPPQTIQARFRSLPEPGKGVTYTEQQLAYALAFLDLTDEDFG
ncbi:MAG: hypothetical protein AAB927_03075 [Patescibacteria group bacterium]